MKIFLSGAMSGLDKEQYNSWRIKAEKLFKHYNNSIIVINPATYYNFDMDINSYTDREIREFDLNAVRNSNVVLVNLSTDSIGTSNEEREAEIHNIPIIGFAPHNNIHPWMKEPCNKICDTLQEAVEYIVTYYSEIY